MDIDCAFPGGNIVVESINPPDVRLHQDLRDTGIDWFYWCLRVRGPVDTPLRFVFTRSRAIGVRGPAVSADGGRSWAWLGRDAVYDNAFRYSFTEAVSEIRLSFAMPYQQWHWRHFVDEVGTHPAVQQDQLCVTARGRPVECLILNCRDKLPKHRVAITCRHHACEMMASYVLEGLIRWVLQDPGAEWLRNNVAFICVPFVDKDGVEDGDQGKGRRPRDHGRDYEGVSLYAATGAIRERLPCWGNGRLRVGLDLHCPHISGVHSEVIYLVGDPRERIDREQRRFSQILEASATGPLPFAAGDFLPFGESWNTKANYTGGKGFCPWLSELPEVRLATSIEVPYANAAGAEVNQSSARRFGADLGRGLAQYLRSLN
jgi:hypothetical protein